MSSMTTTNGTIIYWFRKALRLHDNPALNEAIKQLNSDCVLKTIFILDSVKLSQCRIGSNRWRFILQSLENLHEQLQRNLGCPLYVIRGEPESIFTTLIKKWNIRLIAFENEIEPYAKIRDAKIIKLAQQNHIKVHVEFSHNLYISNEILEKNNNQIPLTYQKFLSLITEIGEPEKPVDLIHCEKFDPALYNDYSREYFLPNLDEIEINESDLNPCIYKGGETEALNRLKKYLKQESWICNFEKPKTSPNSIEPSTTVLSPYLACGSLSARLFYKKLKQILNKKKKHSKPPVSLIGQLYWREFFYVIANHTENFDQMIGNKVCLQIPWSENKSHLDAWTYGITGYPYIDAIMRQLRNEGWIHHLARHSVACFLTRGDLWISWEAGQAVFEELLLDADWALNAGNWLWLSASAFFTQYFRVYSPIVFGKKTDPDGLYIRKYVPELMNYPNEFIYEPWNAPKSVQKKAKCIIGQDYPKRIVIHKKAMKNNLTKMSRAYKNRKKVNNPSKKLKTL